MKILVQHAKFDRITGEVLSYQNVAEVDAYRFDDVNEALEYAYRYTNNVMGSWSLKIGEDANDDVEVLVKREDGMGLRSSMMGDRFIVDGTTYKVAAFGFKEVQYDEAVAALGFPQLELV